MVSIGFSVRGYFVRWTEDGLCIVWEGGSVCTYATALERSRKPAPAGEWEALEGTVTETTETGFCVLCAAVSTPPVGNPSPTGQQQRATSGSLLSWLADNSHR